MPEGNYGGGAPGSSYTKSSETQRSQPAGNLVCVQHSNGRLLKALPGSATIRQLLPLLGSARTFPGLPPSEPMGSLGTLVLTSEDSIWAAPRQQATLDSWLFSSSEMHFIYETGPLMKTWLHPRVLEKMEQMIQESFVNCQSLCKLTYKTHLQKSSSNTGRYQVLSQA